MVRSGRERGRIAVEINEALDSSRLARTLRIGKLVKDLAGDAPGSEGAPPHKESSLRALAKETRLSAAALSRAVGVYELVAREPWLKTEPSLSVSHLEVILPLPPAEQVYALALAKQFGWKVRDLRLHVRRTQCDARERPRTRELRRALGPLLAAGRAAADMSEAVSRRHLIDPETADELRRATKAVRALCDQIAEIPSVRSRGSSDVREIARKGSTKSEDPRTLEFDAVSTSEDAGVAEGGLVASERRR